MQNKLLSFIREHDLVQPGDTVFCAVSGGADSMALLGAMSLLKEKLGIHLEVAHFNHNLRGEESLADETFVRNFCLERGIRCHVGSARVQAGEKGLEAAAREARYAFLEKLNGKIATAHTADDNAETLLMHLLRGSGLNGLGGIAPVRGKIIRPMLTVTRQDVLAFLENQQIHYVTDSSNETDAFLRNRIRHHVMPLLKEENPSIAGNLSATALRLRQDAQLLDSLAQPTTEVQALRQMPPALQARVLAKLLVNFGVKEPEAAHVEQLRKIVNSPNPSAWGEFPGEVVVGRCYDTIVKLERQLPLGEYPLMCPGRTEIPELGLRVVCEEPHAADGMAVSICGALVLRSRRMGDTISLSCGTKTLKKLFIDAKIPAMQRERIPVIADEQGVVMIPSLNLCRDSQDSPTWVIRIETM